MFLNKKWVSCDSRSRPSVSREIMGTALIHLCSLVTAAPCAIPAWILSVYVPFPLARVLLLTRSISMDSKNKKQKIEMSGRQEVKIAGGLGEVEITGGLDEVKITGGLGG